MAHGTHPRMKRVAELATATLGLALVVSALRADTVWFEMHVGEEFCVVRPEQLHTFAVWRWIGAGVGFAILLAARPLVGRWASRRSPAAALVDLAGIAVAALLALGVCDWVLRRRRDAAGTEVKGVQPAPSILPPIRDDPRYGWSYLPHTSFVIPTFGRDVEYSFDWLGDRARTMDPGPDLERPSILLVGESFASGVGVPWQEALGGRLEARTGEQVVDGSVWGFDNGQEYGRMQDLLPRLAHPVAVVVLVLMQQLDRDGRDSFAWHPRFVLSDGALREAPRPPAWWQDSALRQRTHDVLAPHDASAVDVAHALFVAMAHEARARGAYPLFLLTNWGKPCLPDDTGAPSSDRLLFGGVDVPHVRVDLDPWAEDMNTHHPTPRGQRMLADAVVRALVEAHVINPPPPG